MTDFADLMLWRLRDFDSCETLETCALWMCKSVKWISGSVLIELCLASRLVIGVVELLAEGFRRMDIFNDLNERLVGMIRRSGRVPKFTCCLES